MNDISNLLDGTLDDLADLPEFSVFPAGSHRVLASMSLKDIPNKGMCPEISFKLVETFELAEPAETAQAEGTECSSLFMLDNEFGQGKFKEICTAFAEYAQSTVPREIIEQVTDVECVLISSQRVDKNDPTKKYLNIVQLSVV